MLGKDLFLYNNQQKIGDMIMVRLIFFTRKIAVLIVPFLIALSSSSLAQFTADMIQTKDGETTTSKIYVENPFYCFEVKEEGEKTIVIVNQQEKTTTLLIPVDKMYMEMGSRSMVGAANDVFQSINKLTETTEPSLVGTETIQGYECKKYIVTREGQNIMVYWQSPDLGFPIKVVNEIAGSTMELTNIQEGDVDDSMFIIPSDYQKMNMPDWQ